MSDAFYNALCDHQHFEGYEEGYKDGYEAGKRDAASQWRRVEERLPDDSREVIIFTASKIIGVGSFIRPNWYQWYSGGGLPVDVTHWMPLPEPPKEIMHE